MKIFKLFPLACAALMMSACSSDDGNGSENPNIASEAQYLAVNIVNVGTTPTRAAVPGYENGTAEESEIKKIRFYFFHADGSAYKLEGPTPGSVENYLEKEIKPADMGTADGTGTVGAITKAILVINGTTKKAPASVIAVVNPQSLTSLGTDAKTLNELTNTLTGSQFYTVATKDQFVMTNSVYVEAGRTVCPVTVAGHIGTDATTAEAYAIDIYAERVVAKVGADFQSEGSKLEANTAGTSKYGMKVGTYGASTDIYAVIDGWGVADENDNAYVEKHITNSWTDTGLGITTWTTSDYHRSFWGTSPAFAAGSPTNHKFVDYKAQHGDVLYTLPNTPTTAVAAADVYKNDLTKFLVTATLRYQDATGTWQNAEICKYQGVEYLGINALKEAIATTYNMYFTKDGGDYTPIQAGDVTFKTVAAGTTGVEDYQVVPVLNDTKTYYKKDASSATGYTALTASDNISKYPAEVRTDGKVYYFIPISHLATDAAKVGYYGVVRNHWYKVNVKSLKGFGTPVYDEKKIIDPTIPEDQATYLAAKINVLQWRVVSQDVNLGK